MFVTNWISPTKIQKISEITNFFRHYFLSRTEVIINQTMKITKKETRVSVRITPYQETQLDLISEKLGIKRSTLVRYAIDNLISSYNDLQLEQI